MATCEFCGNDYDKAFSLTLNGNSHTFDCFECAIAAVAPQCRNCGVRIVGHGVEVAGTMFCCAHCASRQGAAEVRDRA